MDLWDCRDDQGCQPTLSRGEAFRDDVKARGRTASSSISPLQLSLRRRAGNSTKMLVVTMIGPRRRGGPPGPAGRARGRTHPPMLTVAQAVEQARRVPGRPVVAADVADNPGGGFPGDSTVGRRALVELGVTDCAFATIWDPIAVTFARAAGPGARLRMRIGGKAGILSGDPLDLDVIVAEVTDDLYQRYAGVSNSLGPAARVTVGGLDIILASRRNQVRAPTSSGVSDSIPSSDQAPGRQVHQPLPRRVREDRRRDSLHRAARRLLERCRSRGSPARSGRSILRHVRRSPGGRPGCPPADQRTDRDARLTGAGRLARPDHRRGAALARRARYRPAVTRGAGGARAGGQRRHAGSRPEKPSPERTGCTQADAAAPADDLDARPAPTSGPWSRNSAARDARSLGPSDRARSRSAVLAARLPG